MLHLLLFVQLLSPAVAAVRLIGGEAAPEAAWRSTVRLNSSCTGVKVGPRAFLTAAHCLQDGHNPVSAKYAPGEILLVQTHYSYEAAGPRVVTAYPHPSYALRLGQRATLGLGHNSVAFEAYDVGVVLVADDTPDIPVAELALDGVHSGETVVIGGFGCTQSTLNTAIGGDTFKVQTTDVLHGGLVRDAAGSLFGERFRNARRAEEFNFLTPGRGLRESAASLCPGDSGGPVYRPDGRVVGVNSQYIFNADAVRRHDGVSTANTHTRIDRVADWLRETLGKAE